MDTQPLLNELKNLTVAATTVFSKNFAHGHCRCELTANGQLAAVFKQIGFAAPASRALSTDELTALGQDLGTRLHYLLEPVAPIEIDGDGVVLQMRSVPPTDEGNKVRSYYELLVRSDQLLLRRYTTAAGQPRDDAEMTLTHELFGRLMEDFASAHATATSA